MLKITVNGNQLDSAAKTLAELCLELQYGDAKIATALNGNFIAKEQRKDTALAEQDTVEIVAPRQGG